MRNLVLKGCSERQVDLRKKPAKDNNPKSKKGSRDFSYWNSSDAKETRSMHMIMQAHNVMQ